MVARKLALTAIAKMGTATQSTANARATGSSIWSSGGATANALLLLPLKSRSGTDYLQFLRRLGGRKAANEGRSDEARKALRERGILLLPLKLPGFGSWLLSRSFCTLALMHHARTNTNSSTISTSTSSNSTSTNFICSSSISKSSNS
jgi:hypothetical protein